MTSAILQIKTNNCEATGSGMGIYAFATQSSKRTLNTVEMDVTDMIFLQENYTRHHWSG